MPTLVDWKPGDRLTHRFNPGLGPGLVQEIDGRTLVVGFPETGTTLRLALNTDALRRFEPTPGLRARLADTGETVLVAEALEDLRYVLDDGREVGEAQLWPLQQDTSLIDRLAEGDVDSQAAFGLRLEAREFGRIREAGGLGSFLGGRIRLFPHQLYAAERASRADPVRWLLADEVGLGKTVEACLILNRLLRTGRVERTLVIAPATLTVQWLGELWRKYHQVFVLIDDKRLNDVERDYGEGFNPFDAYHRAVLSVEYLLEHPYLADRAIEAGIDLLVVDEAHHLRRPAGHPGNPEYRAIAPIAAAVAHTMLLTATPLEDDAHGFFRLLQLLRPDEFPDGTSFEERLQQRDPLPPCTSATRRADIGGLPPRQPEPVQLDGAAWSSRIELLDALRSEPAEDAAARKRKARRLRRALASGASLEAILRPKERDLKRLARAADEDDPRLAWLAEQAPSWRDGRNKTLIFVAQRESLELIRTTLGRVSQVRTGVFHEDLTPGQRDIEVAQFRTRSGPSVLISTECGGEGRNFEFCRRIVLFDLPWNPIAVEQRIGRLDRIGRDRPVEIVYFHPGSGLGGAVVDLYETLGLFKQPLGSFERELAAVEDAIEELALSDADIDDASHFKPIVEDARRAYTRVQEAAYHELHRDPYTPEMADGILARVPDDLDERTEELIVGIAEQLNLHVESHRDGTRHSIELGTRSRVESLPGVPSGSSFLGSFLREEAVADEQIDFFASGHPLVEGLLQHFADSPIGRVAAIHQKSPDGQEGFGVFAIVEQDDGRVDSLALDVAGNERDDWVDRIMTLPLKSRRVPIDEWSKQPSWSALIHNLGERILERGRPVAIAAIRFSA